MSTIRYLMCPPDYFQIDWAINPYMHLEDRVDETHAKQQYEQLVAKHTELGHELEFMPAQPGLADLIFTANGALVIGDKVMLGHPRPNERKPEIPFFKQALQQLGYTHIETAPYDFSGQGDALPVGNRLIFMGNSWRTDPRMQQVLEQYFDRDVVSLATIRDLDLPADAEPNSRFYDIDIAMSVLGPNTIAYCPEAFELESRNRLEQVIKQYALIAYPIPLSEALKGAMNLITDGVAAMRPLVDAPVLAAAIKNANLIDHQVDISELWKAGGGVRCTTLNIFS